MTNSEADIVCASENDLDGIVALQAANQPEHGGTLSANLASSRIAAMMREMPLIVARRGNLITGYLMTSSHAMNADVPIISAMLAAYPGTVDAYVYGPICVSAEERGKELAQAMFSNLDEAAEQKTNEEINIGRQLRMRAAFHGSIIRHCRKTSSRNIYENHHLFTTSDSNFQSNSE